MLVSYALIVTLLAVIAGADEIAFQADPVYNTNSQGADPGPVERGGDGLNFIDLSPDGRFLLCIGHLYKSWGEYYWLFARDRRDNVTLLEYQIALKNETLLRFILRDGLLIAERYCLPWRIGYIQYPFWGNTDLGIL